MPFYAYPFTHIPFKYNNECYYKKFKEHISVYHLLEVEQNAQLFVPPVDSTLLI